MASKTQREPEPGARRTKSTTLVPPNLRKKKATPGACSKLFSEAKGGLAERDSMSLLIEALLSAP
ncbi:MAG: hypothetical protein HZR80_14845 [Candidatus Heimdallarchaeota archaeon]